LQRYNENHTVGICEIQIRFAIIINLILVILFFSQKLFYKRISAC